jgi:hypothetical protein
LVHGEFIILERFVVQYIIPEVTKLHVQLLLGSITVGGVNVTGSLYTVTVEAAKAQPAALLGKALVQLLYFWSDVLVIVTPV